MALPATQLVFLSLVPCNVFPVVYCYQNSQAEFTCRGIGFPRRIYQPLDDKVIYNTAGSLDRACKNIRIYDLSPVL